MNWVESKKGYESFLRLEKSLSQNSISAYINDINKLISFLEGKFKELPPDKVKLQHLREFVEWMNQKGVSPRTQARTISGIKSFYKYLLMEGVIENDPTTLLESPKIGRKLPDILSDQEINDLINAIDLSKPEGQRNKAMIETLYSCGLRVSELVNLKLSNLHFDQEFIKIEGKGDKERLVPISKQAIEDINKYLIGYRKRLKVDKDSENILFLNRRGKQLSRVMIFTIIKNLAQKINLKKNISPHTFRHSFASQLIDGGADLRAVQEMLGHESILTTEIYTHLDKDYLKDTVNRHHPRS
ncbi:site-specific tyrosine recombinase XerD [Prolixibacter denitrificans]|jgi:integrase/recombinase XerD|uniref:Tyrosine recombinase XerC n=1 Tax=Prolixibacter denitrificans TaxID=1541063 RepID=A0A2P8CFW8_9BACT|nr:site-specific tyrosine recombinase XerD [Prolixibacter denitrificans]PSK83883.1 integrase/recombinase XerD [Prolixibacter denitrificans]GET23424.1 tyrosine recombinase XerC [Prolixibacter denitrificans]